MRRLRRCDALPRWRCSTSTRVGSRPRNSIARICTTVRAFADTNIAVYAESDDGERSVRARSILEASPVISTQVVNEAIAALTRKYGFSKADANEVATALMDL